MVPQLADTGFQVLFHSPPGVLFTFPSQYSALSVTSQYLALRGGPRSFPQGFSCPVVLRMPLHAPCLRLRGFHPFQPAFPGSSAGFPRARLCGSLPRRACTPVWAPSLSLAATQEIDVSFFSSGYLDVSVRRVPLRTLLCLTGIVHLRMHEVSSCGFPHSDTHGLTGICPSPWLFAACRVFLRLLVPRHPPCALISLTSLAAFLAAGCIALQPGQFWFFPWFSCLLLLCFSCFSSSGSSFRLRRPRLSLSRRLLSFSDLIRVFFVPVFGFQGTIRAFPALPAALAGFPFFPPQWA